MTAHHWSDDLQTGHAPIDNQHRELFDWVLLLDRAMTTQNKDDIESIIQFLEHYVEAHFSEEETLMTAHHYDGYDHHKEDHEIFKARVFSLRHDFDSGVPLARSIFALRMCIDKLVYHIKTIDIGISDIAKGH
jgi:hemerythrin